MNNKIKAHEVLDAMFSHVSKYNKDTKFISVQIEECMLYIPVQNLDEEFIPEFKRQFKRVYMISQGK